MKHIIKHIIFSIALISFLPALNSCMERELKDIKLPDYPDKLVLNGTLSNEGPVSVEISRGVAISSSSVPQYITDATVYLYDGANKLEQLVYNSIDGVYQGTVLPVKGKDYRIVASANRLTTVEATASVPPSLVNLSSVFKDSVELDSMGVPVGRITVKWQDQPNEENFYRINLFYYISSVDEWRPLEVDSEDPVFQEFGYRASDGSYSFSDRSFNGKLKEIKLKTPFAIVSGSPKFIVMMENLSADYFRYYRSLDLYNQTQGNPLVEPVYIYSNVKNGLGIFAGSNIQRDTIR